MTSITSQPPTSAGAQRPAARPSEAIDCSWCLGDGRSPLATNPCRGCDGRGWVIPVQEIDSRGVRIGFLDDDPMGWER